MPEYVPNEDDKTSEDCDSQQDNDDEPHQDMLSEENKESDEALGDSVEEEEVSGGFLATLAKNGMTK